MKKLLCALLLAVSAAESQDYRNPFNTNRWPNIVLPGNLVFTNYGSSNRWLFYGADPYTVARLKDFSAYSNGTVLSFTFTDTNGIYGTVVNPGTTPNLSLRLGTIAPTNVAAIGTVTGSNLSGTNTGDQTITLSGDATGSGTNGITVVLSTSGVTAAAYGATNKTLQITFDAKGRATLASAVDIKIRQTNIVDATATRTSASIPISSTAGWLTSWVEASTTSSNGLVTLANHLGGTAAAPTVLGAQFPGNFSLLHGALTNGQYLQAASGSNYIIGVWGSNIVSMNVSSNTTVGTWTKPAGAIATWIDIIGSGAGGGSGRKGTNGSNAGGGGGGAGGARQQLFYWASALPNNLSVNVNSPGVGAAAQSTNSSDGLNGVSANSVYIRSTNAVTVNGVSVYMYYAVVFGGARGVGGTTTTAAGGAASTGTLPGTAGASGGTGNGSSPTSLGSGADGGAGGGGVNSSGVLGTGGYQANHPLTGIHGAFVAGTTNGYSIPTLASLGFYTVAPGRGGFGGAGSTNSAGYNGGDGQFPGGGGGGGGGVWGDGLFNSGAGGNGGGGLAMLYTLCIN